MLSIIKLLGYHLTLNICNGPLQTLITFKSKLYKPKLPKLTKKNPDNICHVQFSNKGIESIHFHQYLTRAMLYLQLIAL